MDSQALILDLLRNGNKKPVEEINEVNGLNEVEETKLKTKLKEVKKKSIISRNQRVYIEKQELHGRKSITVHLLLSNVEFVDSLTGTNRQDKMDFIINYFRENYDAERNNKE